MNLSTIAIKRPITMLMLFLGIILFGIVCLSKLPVELMPNASFHRITILALVRGGMPPADVEHLITRPIEDAVSTVTHLDSLGSTSKEGKATIVLSFQPGTDMDFAALEVREKFAKVKNKLPKEMEKPIIAKYEESDVPILILAVTGISHTVEEIRRVVDEVIKERIQRIYGVANIEVGGGRERKILVEVDQFKLQSSSIPIHQVVSSINRNNLNLLVGDYEKGSYKFIIRTIGQFQTVESIKNIPVTKDDNNSLIRLSDIADVKDSFLDATTYARTNSQPVVSLYIQKETTANTVKVVEKILKEIESIKEDIPKDLRILTVSNQAEFIKDAIKTVQTALLYGAFLATIILFLFLRDIRSTLIIGISIPLSVVATFSLMYFSNITLNVMSLSGLALGIGMLVDNSIVVLENIFKQKSLGLEPIPAAIEGSNQVFLAIVASTITTIVVFLPILFINKQIQLLYSGLALTVTYSLLSSLLIAVTAVPLLSSRGRKKVHVKQNTTGESKKAFSKTIIIRIYQRILIFVLRYKFLFIIAAFLLLFIAFNLLGKLEKQLLASTEEGKFTIFIELPSGAKVEISDQVVKDVEKRLDEIPEIDTFTSRVEGWSSKVYVNLHRPEKREKTVEEVIEVLRPQVKKIGQAEKAFIYFSESRGSGSNEILIDLYGYDYDTLKELASLTAQKISTIKGLKDVKLRMKEGRPEMRLKVDKYKGSLHDLSTKQIADAMHAQIRGLEATRFHSKAREIDTITRLQKKDRAHLSDIRKLTLINKQGTLVELKQIVNFLFGIAPSEIWRKNKTRMIQVSATLYKIGLDKAVTQTREQLKSIEFPKDYFHLFGGDYTKMVENQRQLRFAVIIMLALVYMVLASLFESYIQPLIILISVPLAIIGVGISLYFTGTTISMGVLIGIIMLGGIVVNNAIVLIDYTNFLRKKGNSKFKAIISAGKERLRPIVMTTTTTVLGLLPMAINKSQGASLWSPLAITVIGGLLSSTILTLFIVPSFYIVFENTRLRFKRLLKQ
ncbi:efflux RND transporter permease subunit [Chlamydiota bacterium]